MLNHAAFSAKKKSRARLRSGGLLGRRQVAQALSYAHLQLLSSRGLPLRAKVYQQDELLRGNKARGICFLFFRVPHTSFLRVGLVPVCVAAGPARKRHVRNEVAGIFVSARVMVRAG